MAEIAMIERVAKAIYHGRNGQGATPWSRLPKAHKGPYRDDARAAVTALRDISGNVGDAGYNAFEAWERGESSLIPHGPIWRAIIDAILQEDPPHG